MKDQFSKDVQDAFREIKEMSKVMDISKSSIRW